jgi:hypothetical protein
MKKRAKMKPTTLWRKSMLTNMKDGSISWAELAELTHATQVERFNWCSCEEQEEYPYADCPREGESNE